MRYKASERAWVMRLLARLTPEERAEYERRCALPSAARGAQSGKIYDDEKARIAEQVMLAFRGTPNRSTPEDTEA